MVLCIPFCVLLAPNPTSASNNTGPDRGQPHGKFISKVQTLVDRSCMDKKNMGLRIESLNDDTTLFTLNENKPFIPASNVKLVTTAASLKILGPDYQFLTRLYADGTTDGGVVNGNIYLKGSGDPFFVSEEMWIMIRDLKNRGIHKITGDLVVDDSFFDGRRIEDGVMGDPGPQAYNARVGATSLNFNTVTVYVSPARKPGKSPRVVVDPKSPYIRIDNAAVTVRPGRKRRLIVNRAPGEGFDTITVKGKISSTAGRERFFLNVSDPPAYTAGVFRSFLKDMGVRLEGKTRYGTTPDTARVLLTHRSKRLSFIVRGLNKFSNNFIAEQLLKSLGATEEGVPGTFGKGLRSLSRYLRGLGILPGSYVLEDGSGLSRNNRLSPRQIVRVLKAVYRDFKIRPEFLASLSIMGVDGTVQERLADQPRVRYKTRVKTGTLDGVSSLSGYVSTINKQDRVFSLLMNYKRGCSARQVLDLQDAIVKIMVEEGR